MKAGHTPTEITHILERHKSTTSRELRRNSGLRGYRREQAHRLSVARRQNKAQARIATAHWDLVKRLLREDWSPEQISWWLAEEMAVQISQKWIYQYDWQTARQNPWCIGPTDARHRSESHRFFCFDNPSRLAFDIEQVVSIAITW